MYSTEKYESTQKKPIFMLSALKQSLSERFRMLRILLVLVFVEILNKFSLVLEDLREILVQLSTKRIKVVHNIT